MYLSDVISIDHNSVRKTSLNSRKTSSFRLLESNQKPLRNAGAAVCWSAVYVAAMAHIYNQDQDLLILDLCNDAIVSNTIPP